MNWTGSALRQFEKSAVPAHAFISPMALITHAVYPTRLYANDLRLKLQSRLLRYFICPKYPRRESDPASISCSASVFHTPTRPKSGSSPVSFRSRSSSYSNTVLLHCKNDGNETYLQHENHPVSIDFDKRTCTQL
jgi:hypothetical protein